MFVSFPCLRIRIKKRQNHKYPTYRIYSINRPRCLLNFCTLRVGAYSRWALIKFSSFSGSVVCLFCMVITKSEDVTKQGFCKILWGKLCLREGLLLSLIWVCVGGRRNGGGRLFEAGRWLALSGFRMGAYSRWALIWGWALIRINTVWRASDISRGCGPAKFMYFREIPQNSQKNAKYREIRQKYFQIHISKTYLILILAIRPVLFTPNVQI